MSNRDNYQIPITLSREFATWIHSDTLLSPVKDISDLAIEAWSKHGEAIAIEFGGLYGSQFKTEAEFLEFRTEFLKALDENSIDQKHEHAIYYFISFYEQETTQQSIKRNHHNTLLSEGRFLIDLIEDSYKYFEKLEKDDRYELHYDPDTEEPIFIKKKFLNLTRTFYLEFADSYSKQPDDVIRFHRLLIYKTVVYIKPNFNFSLTRNLPIQDPKGKPQSHIEFPGSAKLTTFLNVLHKLTTNQKTHSTTFYHAFNSYERFDLRRIEQLRNGYNKNSHSHSDVINKIAVALSDYLEQFVKLKNKTAIARFIYSYFVLFKAIENRSDQPIPNSYAELDYFYKQQGYSFNYVRLKLKGK